ncbi:MAG: IPT/TIG domain-containing protein [Limisphaerales bacterium]
MSALYVDLRETPFWPGPLRVAHLLSARAGGDFGSQTPGGFYVFNFPPEILGFGPAPVSRYLVTTTRQAYSATDQTRYHELEEDDEEPRTKRSGIIHITPTGRSAVVDSAPNVGFHTVAGSPPPPLRVLDVRPRGGPVDGGTDVRLAGSGFDADAEIRFADRLVPPGQTRFLSSGDLLAVAPPGGPGAVTVSVRNPRTGETAVAPAAYEYGTPLLLPPTISGAEPTLGPLAGGNLLEIRGANFVEGTRARIGGHPALSTRRDSPLLLTVQLPAGEIGSADLEVTNPDGATGILVDGYNYGERPPEVWTVVPRFGPVAGGTKLTIVGTGFETGAAVNLGDQPAEGVQFGSAQVLTATAPPVALPGPVDLTVRNPSGVRRVVPGAYRYGQPDPHWPAPTLLAVTPQSSPTAGGVAVQILGTGFEPDAAVFFDQTPTRGRRFGPYLIETISPPHASGIIAVRVVNPDGKTAELPADQGWNSFTYDSNDPWISLVNPMSSATTGGEEITLFGSNFRPGAQVEFGGVPAVSIEIGEAVIFAQTPPHAPGPVSIKVTNPGGLSCLYEGDLIFGRFEYAGSMPGAPAVDRIVPAEGSVLGGIEVRLEGANLYAGARVFFAGTEAIVTGRHLPDRVTIRLPAGTLGLVDLEVRNADR